MGIARKEGDLDGGSEGDVLGDNMVLGVSATKPRDSFPPVFWVTIFWATQTGIPGSGSDTSLNLPVLQRRPVTDMDERR